MLLTRHQILAVYNSGPEAVVSLVEKLLAHVEQLQQQAVSLSARVQELEDQQAKNSHNSSKPPASDGLKKKPKSLRDKSSNQSGGQPGHPGTTLCLSQKADQIVLHTPAACSCCGLSLESVVPLSWERRQVHDLPPLRLFVTEHRALEKVCPACQTKNQSAFPPSVSQPVQYGQGVQAFSVYLQEYQLLPFERTRQLLCDLFGCSLSEGTLANFLSACHNGLAAVEAAIKRAVQEAKTGHFDETGVRIGKALHWLHVSSTPSLTYYAHHPKRGKKATDAIGILPSFYGTAVHDAWPSYFGYACEHALCNAHLLRELIFVKEQMHQSWAGEAMELLLDIKRAVKEAKETGAASLSEQTRQAFQERYDLVLGLGTAANPPGPAAPVAGKRRRGRRKQSPAKNLLDRMERYHSYVLAFMHDFLVPFDNNLAERDLRMSKVRQKISGCFRSAEGAWQFCRIRGYISTLRKQGTDVLSALRSVFAGNPYVPVLHA